MKHIFIALLVLLSGCATQSQTTNRPPSDPTKAELHLTKGYSFLAERRTKQAIVEFDKAIASCNEQYINSDQKLYASRGMTETIYYMLKAAAEEQSAIAVGTICSDALYLKGYASLDMGRIEVAEDYIKQAINMAPVNSMYLSELGHIYQSKNDWQAALDIFIRSEEAANTYSPDEIKNQELTRAKRGVGYNLIELGRLDEAEQKFKECLSINSTDQGAINELKYIEKIRNNEIDHSFIDEP